MLFRVVKTFSFWNKCCIPQCCDFEVINMELFMSLDGVGLSLVNSKPDEVAYITLSRYVRFFVDSHRILVSRRTRR